MDYETIKKIVNERGYAFLTSAQKNIYNAGPSSSPLKSITATNTSPSTSSVTTVSSNTGQMDSSERAAFLAEQVRLEAERKEKARQDAIKLEGIKIANSGGGTTAINNFYYSLSDADKQLVKPFFGSNIIAGYTPRTGNIQQTTIDQTGIFTNTSQDFTQQIESIIENMIKSGKSINANLTEQDLADLDPAEFLRQAEIEVAPEYAGQFAQVKDELTRSLTNIGYDLTKTRENNQRVTEQNLEAGTEDLAGRGLAFSGQRTTFEKDTAGALSRANEAARELAFRNAQSSGTRAESLIGSTNLQNYSTPQVDGQRGFSLSSAPVLGSLVGEKQLIKENMAKQLELDERVRRSMASSNLSFA